MALLFVFLFFLVYPINVGLIRGYLVVCFPLLLAGLLFLVWQHKILRITLLVFVILCAFLLLGPGRTINPRRLQNRYVVTLISFESTRYVWGGENRFGIDCSGLIRKGLILSCLEEGLVTINPRLIRSGLEFWWHDCSARALKTGYRNWTQLQFTSPRNLDISLEQLEPGDIAVTSDGIHVLAYLGSGEWIEADPGVGKVLRIRPRDSNSWLTVPVHILRWKILTSQDR